MLRREAKVTIMERNAAKVIAENLNHLIVYRHFFVFKFSIPSFGNEQTPTSANMSNKGMSNA